MKIKEGFVVREIAGETVVVALGKASKIFNGLIRLNGTAKIIWQKLASGCEREEIIEAILEEYEIDRETVEKDVDGFIEKLKGAKILE